MLEQIKPEAPSSRDNMLATELETCSHTCTFALSFFQLLV